MCTSYFLSPQQNNLSAAALYLHIISFRKPSVPIDVYSILACPSLPPLPFLFVSPCLSFCLSVVYLSPPNSYLLLKTTI